MADGKNTFNLYADMIGVFEKLPDEKAGQLIKHIFRYVNDQNPETDDLIINIAFEPIKVKLKRDLTAWEERCSKNTENIRKRWNKEDTTVYNPIQKDSKHTDKDKDKDKDKDIKITTYPDDSVEMRLANLMVMGIVELNTSFKRPNMQSWAKEFNLIIRIDKREPEDIKFLMGWINRNSFWSKNILSPTSLRKQFDRLTMETKNEPARPKTVIQNQYSSVGN